MELTATINGKRYQVDLSAASDISIPVQFDGTGPAVFGASPACKAAFQTSSFIGDRAQGGSCNCDVITFSAHLHGTHTECVGHISYEPVAVCDVLADSLIPVTVVTITPCEAAHTKETYVPPLRASDRVITRSSLENALADSKKGFLSALVIRTLPNKIEKIQGERGIAHIPFFTTEAMDYLRACGIQHLLVDMPSIDRLDDEGKLSNHHHFWECLSGNEDTKNGAPSRKTITELIYVPERVIDGCYLLNLQVAAFVSDAAPSRPLLYALREL